MLEIQKYSLIATKFKFSFHSKIIFEQANLFVVQISQYLILAFLDCLVILVYLNSYNFGIQSAILDMSDVGNNKLHIFK